MQETSGGDIRREVIKLLVIEEWERILDGRNRLEACRRAGVEPRYETYEGDDPAGYALSVNTNRRDLSKGQKAMIAAKANVLSGNHSTQRELARMSDLSQDRIKRAAVVLEHAPDLVGQVIAGGSLDDAYAIAQERKRRQEREAEQLASLRQTHPELDGHHRPIRPSCSTRRCL